MTARRLQASGRCWEETGGALSSRTMLPLGIAKGLALRRTRHRHVRPRFLACACLYVLSNSMLQAEARKIRLTWINGIATHMQHMEEGQAEISKLFGGEPVLFCYNPTSQSHDEDLFGWFGDLTQAGTQKLGLITQEVNALVLHLRQALAAVGPRGCVVHIAHSQGALITSLACKQLTPAEMQRLEIISFGGAAALRKTPATPFRRCINYYAVNDPLLWVAPSAAQSLRSGRVVGDADEEFCFLAPRAGDPIADHDLTGPTYRQALQWEGARFRREHRSLGYKIFVPIYSAMLTLLRLIHERFQALVKAVVRSVLHAAFASWHWVQTTVSDTVLFVRSWIVRPAFFLFMLFVDVVRSFFRGPERYELVVHHQDGSNNNNKDSKNDAATDSNNNQIMVPKPQV